MNIYDTNVLVGVVQNLLTPKTFFLDMFFPRVVTFETQFITWDTVLGKRRLSPFVSPLVEGKIIKSLGRRADTFDPPYIKDKRVLDPKAPLVRQVGEQIGGAVVTPGEREQANMAFQLQDQIDMLQRRLEYMAIDALLDGIVTVTGDGFPTQTVDFSRDAGLTITLSGGSRWGQAGVSPADNLEDWATLIIQKSGATPTDIVFTPEAWRYFIADQKVKDAVHFPRAGESNFEFGSQPIEGAMFKGVWGSFRLWVFNGWYVDDNDAEQRFLPANTVIMGSAQLEGARCFGCVQDPKANYQAAQFFPKSWIQDDPAVRFLMLQSAPLMVPTRVNASAAITVA